MCQSHFRHIHFPGSPLPEGTTQALDLAQQVRALVMQEDLGLDPQQSYKSLGDLLCRHSQHCGVRAEAGG